MGGGTTLSYEHSDIAHPWMGGESGGVLSMAGRDRYTLLASRVAWGWGSPSSFTGASLGSVDTSRVSAMAHLPNDY